MRLLSLLILFAFLFLAANSYAQSLHHFKNGKILTPTILVGVDEEISSLNISKLNGKMISYTFRMPVFNPKGIDAKILTARPFGEYHYNMPNMFPEDKQGSVFQFYKDRKEK